MLYSLQATEFVVGKDILNILQNYQCSTVEHSDTKEGLDRPGQKVKAILSAAFEKKVCGVQHLSRNGGFFGFQFGFEVLQGLPFLKFHVF